MNNSSATASSSADYLLSPQLGSSNWHQISDAFGICHKHPMNILAHLVTTPIGLLGVFSLLRKIFKTSVPSAALAFIYLLSLLNEDFTNGIVLGTSVILLSVVYLASKFRLGWIASIFLIALGYSLQDIAHYVYNEKTLQSSYSNGGHIDLANLSYWFSKLNEQNYYLLPLLIHVSKPLLHLYQPLPLPEGLDVWFSSSPSAAAVRICSSQWLISSFAIFVFGQYAIDSNNFFCFFPGVPYFNRVVQVNLVKDKDGHPRRKEESCKDDLKCIRDYAMSTNPPETCSTHFWFTTMPEKQKQAFSRCAKSSIIIDAFKEKFGDSYYEIDNVEGMDEVYITGPSRLEEQANSDQVFYTRHVDGPWAFVPFVSVYRCIVGMDCNKVITTHFPLANVANNACEGDVLGFDFNREVHYITRDDTQTANSDKFRVVLKTHYVMYPRFLKPLGWLMSKTNEEYNKTFRILFLKTINPQTGYERFLAWNVNFQTWLFDRIETLIGMRNIFYIVFAAFVAFIAGNYDIFLVATSYVHYFRYITTYYYRGNVDFGSFKRDVLLFKSLALAQLFYFYTVLPIYEKTFNFDLLSISIIVSGYAVSILATNALGIDRTYFGVELGIVKVDPNERWIAKFPYVWYIPHPMIVSQIFALTGIHICKHFNDRYPQLIPVHILLYMLHMTQEHFDIYDKNIIRDSVSVKESKKKA